MSVLTDFIRIEYSHSASYRCEMDTYVSSSSFEMDVSLRVRQTANAYAFHQFIVSTDLL